MAIIENEKNLSTSAHDFIAEAGLPELLAGDGASHTARLGSDTARLDDVIAKSMSKEPLSLEETAVLLAAHRPQQIERIFDAARRLKRDVYGNRIVLFAPLYIGNDCTNDCAYCAFRRSNKGITRRTLGEEDIRSQVEALLNRGHKRLILVFGEHPSYTPDYIAQCMRQVYSIRAGRGEIRRVNINAAPMDHEGYAAVKAADIGTYQIFQETYHRQTYAKVHPPATRKGHYMWRLDGVARAIEADCVDVGIGALFGLYDWRYEVLGLVAHSRHLQKHYNVGPHTISFPRLRPAHGVTLDGLHTVDDESIKRAAAILRLAVPYAGSILTAREPPRLRREMMALGVSQIDAGSRIELGGYTEVGDAQVMEREQFELGDIRSLDEVTRQLLADGYTPSFCTACYRLGRTGERFMEFAIPGFIQQMCTPNALTTLCEYLVDYASEETRAAGEKLIKAELEKLPHDRHKTELLDRLRRIRENDERDLYY